MTHLNALSTKDYYRLPSIDALLSFWIMGSNFRSTSMVYPARYVCKVDFRIS